MRDFYGASYQIISYNILRNILPKYEVTSYAYDTLLVVAVSPLGCRTACSRRRTLRARPEQKSRRRGARRKEGGGGGEEGDPKGS